jgi:rod shape determining protein RodA
VASLTHSRRTERQLAFFRKFDPWLIGSALALLGLGLLSLYSVDAAYPKQNFFRNQVMHVLEGLVPFAIFFFVDPRVWRRYANIFYVVNLGLLALVLRFGKTQGGAQRWLSLGHIDFQPSEFAKLFVILTLSSFFIARVDRIRSFSTFALSLVHVAVPMVLVFKQPHLGATLAILVAWIAISIASGVRLRFLAGALLAIALALTVAVKVPGILQPYQKDRLSGLFNPQSQGNAYQPERAQIAFGAGGLTGEGLFHGKQKLARYIPEQDNDFIFTVIGEEGGLFGCVLVLGLFGLFFYRIWLHMLQAEDHYFRMITAGIFGVLAFHTIVNLGMVLQLAPVVGLWLPFMSYGGTAMWFCMSCVALLLNMRGRQRPVIF